MQHNNNLWSSCQLFYKFAIYLDDQIIGFSHFLRKKKVKILIPAS